MKEQDFRRLKCRHLGSIQTEAVTNNNQAEPWLMVQQPTPSVFR